MCVCVCVYVCMCVCVCVCVCVGVYVMVPPRDFFFTDAIVKPSKKPSKPLPKPLRKRAAETVSVTPEPVVDKKFKRPGADDFLTLSDIVSVTPLLCVSVA